MQFSRNRFTKWLLIIAGVLLVVGAGVYVYFAKISADVISSSTDIFADTLEQPDLNDPTLIRLPDRYTKDEIKSARTKSINGIEAKKLTTKESEISKYIADKASELAKSIPIVKDEKGRTINDLVFKVADSEGQIISPTTGTIARATKIKKVADNFAFDSTVPQKDKDIMLRAYPIIESIYGPRSSSQPIKVFRNSELYRACYMSDMNLIMLDSGDRDDTPIHELVHAFHGLYGLDSIWEEGMAVKVTQLVVKKMNLTSLTQSESLISSGYAYRSVYELASVDDEYVADTAGSTPYMYGSAIIDTFYGADSAFLKNFNNSLYKINLSQLTAGQVLTTIAQTIKSVEGEDTLSWLSKRYGLTAVTRDEAGDLPQMFSVDLWQEGYHQYIDDRFSITLRSNYILGDSDFEINVFDSRGKLLMNNDNCTNTRKLDSYVGKECDNDSTEFRDYDGVVKIETTPTAKPENKKIQYLIKVSSKTSTLGRKFYILDLSAANYAKITNSAGAVKFLTKESGYFASADSWFSAPGNYKIETYKKTSKCTGQDLAKCAGSAIGKKIYYRPNNQFMVHYSIAMPTENLCSGEVNLISPLNNGAIFSVTSSNNCGYVITANKIPLARYWGKDLKYTLRQIDKNTRFNLGVSFAGDGTQVKNIIKKLRTANYPNLELIDSQNLGDPANNDFKRRLIFNYPIDMESVDLSLVLNYGVENIGVNITNVDNKTIDVSPKSHIYNNAPYSLIGIDKITDLDGNLITGSGYRSDFMTSVNPVDGEIPHFLLMKNMLTIGESPAVKANFDLTNYLAENQTVPISTSIGRGSPLKGGSGSDIIIAQIIVSENLLTLKTDAPLPIGEYSFRMVETIDNNNNYIAGRDFNFYVN